MRKKLLLAAFLLVLIPVGYVAYLHADPIFALAGNAAESHVAEGGAIHFLENIPQVDLKGRGYAAGFQHGTLLKSQIGEVVEILHRDIIGKGTFRGFLLETYGLHKARQLEEHIPETYRDEMRGVAEGAQVPYSDILLINTFDDLVNMAGCSSLAVTQGPKSEILVHGRNLDYGIEALAGKSVIFNHLDAGFVSVGFPGYIGALTATGERGLTLSSHTSSVPQNQIGMPTGFLYRKIIEEAATLDEAEELLKKNPRTIGNNLLVSSLKENKVVVFESTAETVVRRSGEDHAVATNHFVSPAFSRLYGAWPESLGRYGYLEHFFESQKAIDAESVQKALSFFDGNEGAWSSVANRGTVQSVIFVPAKKLLYVAKGARTPVTQAGYVEYDYGKL